MRALATELQHDPALAATYAEWLDEPLQQAKRERLRSARRTGQLGEAVDLDLAIDMIWGPLFSRWLQRSGSLTAGYADDVVESALNGLRPR
jgi:hypothetical protein